MIPVSVVIVVKNEERNIKDALESVKDFGEIVVVDAFSSDSTVEICREYPVRIYQHEWQGYAKQKQLAIGYANNEWVLLLDADERVTPGLKEEISGLFSKGNITRHGFYIPRKNYFLGKWIRHSGWWPDCTLRLFRKDLAQIEEREVHEKVTVKGSTGYLKNPLEHFTYRKLSEFIKKMDDYSTLAAKEILSKNPHPSTASLLLKMTVRPLFTYFKMFIIRQGIRDGIHGFILAILYSFYTFLKYLKAWEMR